MADTTSPVSDDAELEPHVAHSADCNLNSRQGTCCDCNAGQQNKAAIKRWHVSKLRELREAIEPSDFVKGTLNGKTEASVRADVFVKARKEAQAMIDTYIAKAEAEGGGSE